MSEVENTLRQESLRNLDNLDTFELNFKDNVKNFLCSELRKCMVLETRDTANGIWRIKELIGEIEGDMETRYKGTENQIFLNFNDLLSIVASSNLLPRIANIIVIEIPDENIVNENFEVMDKLFKRLNLAIWRKVIFITSIIELLDIFLESLATGTFIKINEFENKVTSIIDTPEKDPLLKTVALGKAVDVQELIKAGADINKFDDNGNTALHIAAVRGHKDVVQTLIQNGAIIIANKDGSTPFELAVWRGHEDIVVMLLENYPAVDLKGGFGDSALIRASRQGYFSIILVLIEYGADVNIQDVTGSSALHIATKNGHYVIAYTLLKHGADVNCTDNSQYTPLHYAALYGYSDIVQALLNNEAYIDPQSSEGETPLDLAKKYGHDEIVQHLKDRLNERDVLRQAINIIKRKSYRSSIIDDVILIN